MNPVPITPVEKLRLKSFAKTLQMRGRAVTTDQKDSLTAVIQDQPLLPDLEHTAQAKLPVYSVVHAMAGSVVNPRSVTMFTETATGRFYDVLRYEESAADNLTWKWFCEAQRQG